MRDRRKTPFFYITLGAAQTLRATFPLEARGQRTAALAIYAAMCEVANEQRSDSFTAPRKLIADYAGVSTRTLDTYVPRLVEAHLITVERRQAGGQHIPSEWSLIEVETAVETLPEEGGETTVQCRGGETNSPPPGGGETSSLGGEISSPLAKPVRHPGETSSPLARACDVGQEVKEEEPPYPHASNGGGAQLGLELTPTPTGGRRRARERFAAELQAWLAEHPAAPELQAQLVPVIDALRQRVTEATFAIWLAPLHAHQLDDDGAVLGTRDELLGWTEDRYGRLLRELLGRPVRVVACGCPSIEVRDTAERAA